MTTACASNSNTASITIESKSWTMPSIISTAIIILTTTIFTSWLPMRGLVSVSVTVCVPVARVTTAGVEYGAEDEPTSKDWIGVPAGLL